MTVHNPTQTAVWTLAEWNQLAGKTITVALENGVYDPERTVDRVRFCDSPYGPDRMVIVEYAGGGSLSFVREFGAIITVVDGEGQP